MAPIDVSAIAGDKTLTFDPGTARSIAAECNSAVQSFSRIARNGQQLQAVGAAGNFRSAQNIQSGLARLGASCMAAADGLKRVAQDLGDAVRAAGQRIETTDALVAAALRSTSDRASGYSAVGGSSGGAENCQPGDPTGTDAFLGRFPCDTSFETSPGGGVVDWGYINSQPADVGKLSELVEAWMSIARDIAATADAMAAGIGGVLDSGTWTGTAADGIRAGSQNVVNIASSTGKNAFSNANVVAGWAAAVIGTRSGFEALKQQLEQQKFAYNTAIAASGFSPTLVAQQQAALQALDQQGRVLMNSTYNPGSVHTSTSLLNLPDPGSPIGTILPMGFVPPGGGGGGAGGGAGTSVASSGGGGGGGASGGGGGGGGSTAGRTGTDAAGQLARQGTGDPVSSAAKNPSSQAGQNPATAAQQAVSKAGDSAKSLGGTRSGAGSMTRPAGLGSLSEAERNAAKAAASGMKGAVGGGGGAGKLGGAGGLGGAAAAESALSRNSSSLSAAEKALAGQQGATASRAASPAAGGPMGARGAGAKGEDDKEHRAAKYLKHVENGEEIAGDLPDTAPPVLGGLNLDTTDDTEASSKPADRT